MGKMPKSSTAAAASPPGLDGRPDVGVGSDVEFVHMVGGPKTVIDKATATSAPVGVEHTISVDVKRGGEVVFSREDVPDEEVVGTHRFPRWRRPAPAPEQAPPTSPT